LARTRGNQVRIIGGRFRRRLLHFPDVDGLRPTSDRVRETLFNWLGQDLSGLTCLDAFAGSGALGFEAASRGARRVVMWERDAKALAGLRRNASELGIADVEVTAADAMRLLAAPGEAFDVIFLDPPFAADLGEESLAGAATRLRPDGRIYVEGPAPVAPRILERLQLQVLRLGRAGHSHYCLLERI
jgi:16S rRNA (guanine966-N2)-methyltransferase